MKKMNSKKTFLILFAIVILGFALRAYKLGENSLVADEFLDINSSYGYYKIGKWKAWNFNFDRVNTENLFNLRDERAWPYKWQVAQLFRWFPPTEGVARSVSVFWGIISIITIYWIAKSFTGKKEIGLISSFLFAISISGIIFDRKLRMYAMFFPVFLVLSWIVFRFLEEKYSGKNKIIQKIQEWMGVNFVWFLPVTIIMLLSMTLHMLAINIVAIIAFYVFVQAVMSGCREKSFKNKYFKMLAAAAAGIAAFYFIFPEKFLFYLGALKLFKDHFSYLALVMRDYGNIFLAYGSAIIGLIYLYQKGMIKEAFWLGSSFLVILLMSVFVWNHMSGPQYIFFIQSFVIILISAGIYAIACFFRDNSLQFKKQVFYATLAFLLFFVPNYGYFFQDNNTYNQTSTSEYPNFKKLFKYFKKNRKEGDVLITRNFRNYYWMGEQIPSFDFGGELSSRDFSLDELKKITTENPSGWIIIPESDEVFIERSARRYMKENFKEIIKEDTKIYQWGAKQ